MLTSFRQQRARLRELDQVGRARALAEAESRELERLLHADACRRQRADQPIPRGVA